MYADYLVHFNKNHDPKSGRFTFGDGNGDGVSPDDYRAPELDKKYSELEKTGLFGFTGKKWLMPNDDPEKEWGKDWAKAVDIGIEAMDAKGMWGNPGDIEDNDVRSWFMFEDQTIGMPEIAYLASKGWSKEKIKEAFKDAGEMLTKNNEFVDAYTGYPKNKKWQEKFKEASDKEPYKGIYDMQEAYNYVDSTDPFTGLSGYLDECIRLSKEMKHSDTENFIMHFNRNHNPKTGQFDFGDGDGDGTVNDHANKSDGSKKTLVVASKKNPRNPFSGNKKTKIEVSDDVYKEIMKSNTKMDIIRGSSSLISGGLYIAAGVLTENPVALGVGVAFLLSSAASYVDSGTHFVNKIIDKKYKDMPVEEFDKLIKLDPTLLGKKYYDPTTKEIVKLNLKQVAERNKSTGIAT